MSMTNPVEVSIQAVSPELIFSVSAAVCPPASAGASARTTESARNKIKTTNNGSKERFTGYTPTTLPLWRDERGISGGEGSSVNATPLATHVPGSDGRIQYALTC